MRVLVIDDDEVTLSGLSALLESDGYHPVALTDGAKAVALLGRERFEAVVTDFELPGANGAEIARTARATQDGVPVIVVSSSTRAQLALDAGATLLLQKPLDYDALLAALERGGGARGH